MATTFGRLRPDHLQANATCWPQWARVNRLKSKLLAVNAAVSAAPSKIVFGVPTVWSSSSAAERNGTSFSEHLSSPNNAESYRNERFAELAVGTNGRGLFAKQDVAAGRELFSCPLYATLLVVEDVAQPEGSHPLVFDISRHPNNPSPAPAVAELYPGSEYLQQWQQHFGQLPATLVNLISNSDIDPAERLALWLLWLQQQKQRQQQLHQYWVDYLNSLPTADQLTNLAMFDAEEIKDLQVPVYMQSAAAARSAVKQIYTALFTFSNSTGSSSSSKAGSSANGGSSSKPAPHPLIAAAGLAEVTFKQFLWAYSCVSSREFGVGPYRLLVPFADMANHYFQENAVWRLNHLNTKTFSLTATRKVSWRQEVIISYGAGRNNQQLLTSYGFTLPGNITDRLVGLSQGSSEALSGRFAASQAFVDRLEASFACQDPGNQSVMDGPTAALAHKNQVVKRQLNLAGLLVAGGFIVKDEGPHYGIQPNRNMHNSFLTDTHAESIAWRRKLAALLSLPVDLQQLNLVHFRKAIKQRLPPVQCLRIQLDHIRSAGSKVPAGSNDNSMVPTEKITLTEQEIFESELDLIGDLITRCENQLHSLLTTAHADQLQLQQPGLTCRQWTAISARLEYKLLLEAALDILRTYQQGLGVNSTALRTAEMMISAR